MEPYLVAGCTLSMVGSIIDNWGMNIQKYAHYVENNLPEEERRKYYMNPRWALGFGVYIFGQILNLVSLGLIDQPTQSILSSFALFSNVLFARYYFSEQMDQRDYLGLFFISCGASLFVFHFVHHKQDITIEMLEAQFSKTEFHALLLFLSTIVSSCLLYLRNKNCFISTLHLTSWRACQQDQSPLAYATLAAINGGVTVTFSKIATVLIRFIASEDFNLMEFKFMSVMLLLWVFMLVSSVHTLNLGLRNSPALIMIPIFYVLSNMTSIIVGTIYYEEYDTFESPYLTFVCTSGVCMTLVGIHMLSQRVAVIKEKDMQRSERFMSRLDTATSIGSVFST